MTFFSSHFRLWKRIPKKMPLKVQSENIPTDSDAIKNASAELGDIFQGISARVYQETGAAGAAGAAGAGAAGAGAAAGSAADKKDFYDADYEVVDDDQQ